MKYAIKIGSEYYWQHFDTTDNLYSAALFSNKKSAIKHLQKEQERIRKVISTLEERYEESGSDGDLKYIEHWTTYTKWYNGVVVEYELVPTGNNYLVQENS